MTTELRQGKRRNPRGVRELEMGSGVYYAVYADSLGKIRRERGGTKTAAVMLYRKRKTQVMEGQKLPERLRRRIIPFGELADDALEYSKAHKITYGDDVIRMKKVRDGFGNRPADSVTPQDIERWLSTHEDWFMRRADLVIHNSLVNGPLHVPALMITKVSIRI